MHTKRSIMGVFAFIALMGGLSAFAQEGASPSKPAPDYFSKEGGSANTIGGMIGIKTYADEDGRESTYFVLYVRPEFAIGKVGVGLDVPLEVRSSDGRIRRELYDEPSDIASMIRYIRYGQKHDDIYVRVGALERATVGHGSIMNRYYGNTDIDTRKVGLQFDMDFKAMGFETVTTSIVDPEAIGGRYHVRPATFFMQDSFLNKLAFGVSGFTDKDAPSSLIDANADGIPDLDSDNRLEYTSDEVKIFGAAVEYPIIDWKIFRLTPYVDYVKIRDFGDGFHYGFLINSDIAVINSKLDFKFEFRDLGDEYIPTYFDSFYEVERLQYPVGSLATKLQALPFEEAVSGWYSNMDYSLLGSFQAGGTFEDYQGKENSSVSLYAKATGLPYVKVQARYEKKYFDGWGETITLDDKSLFVAEIAYPLTGSIDLSVTFTRTWVLNDETGRYDTVDSFTEGIKFSYNF